MSLSYWERNAITGEHRKEFYLAIAVASRNGISTYEALDRMLPSMEKSKHPLAPAIAAIMYRLRGGGDSHYGVKQRTLGTEVQGMFPREEAMLIQSGEKFGAVPQGLENAAIALTEKSKMKNLISTLLIKPVGYTTGLLVMMVFFRIKLIPQFELHHPRASWPTNALVLGWITDNIYFIIATVIAALIALTFGFMKIIPRWIGPKREVLDRYFPLNLVAALNGVDFLRSLAGYIKSQIPISEALDNMKNSGTPYFSWQCSKVLRLMKDGIRVENALTQLSIIPLKYHWIIDVYSVSKDASAAYTTMAEKMAERVTTVMHRVFGWALGNLMMLAIGAALFLVWSTFFGIANSKSVHM